AGANFTVECTAMPSFTPPTASDACNSYTVVQIGSDQTSGNSCLRTSTRTWLAVDACGNSSVTRSQTITYQDTQAPTFTSCPANVTLTYDNTICGNTHSYTVSTQDCSTVTLTKLSGL